MDLVPVVLLAILAAFAAAAGVGWLLTTHMRTEAVDREAVAVEAAVAAVLAQAGHVLGAERDATVRAAVDTVLGVASDKLGDTVAAGSRELGLRTERFEREVRSVSEQLARLGSMVTALQQESAGQHGSLVENLRHVTATSHAEHTITGRGSSRVRPRRSRSRSEGRRGQCRAERMADRRPACMRHEGRV